MSDIRAIAAFFFSGRRPAAAGDDIALPHTAAQPAVLRARRGNRRIAADGRSLAAERLASDAFELDLSAYECDSIDYGRPLPISGHFFGSQGLGRQ